MTSLLGLPLSEAVQRLEAAGDTPVCVEVSSRKGSKGADARVIKVTRGPNGPIVYWSRFQTNVQE